MTEYRLFLGNPGVGKSTLVNCMLGRKVFKSGLSFGAGLTHQLQEYTAPDGVVYLDTPGLADVSIRQEAAREIAMALRRGGVYKLFFLATLTNGRVSPEDIATFNQVVQAIDVPNLEFSVIVNNVKPRQYKMITESNDNFCKISAAINTMNVTTTSITLVPELNVLDEKDNAITSLPADFVTFMNGAPSVMIPRDRVRDIDINSDQYAKQLEEMKTILRQLREDNNALHAKIQDLERRKPGFRESLNTAFNALIREVDSWL